MTQLLDSLITGLRAAGPYLGPVLALAAFAETIVVIGIFIPVTPLLIASGAAAGGGIVGPALLPWVMAGAFLGSTTSYEFGRLLQREGRSQPRMHDKAHQAVSRLFVQHGAAAVIVARFLGPPATVAPFVAGWLRLDRSRFLAANLVASLLWPLAMFGVGYVGGWLASRR